MKSVSHELIAPIHYADGSGDEKSCDFIELREPTGKVSHICCAIEGIVQAATMRAADMLGEELVEEAREAAAAAAAKAKEGGDTEKTEIMDADQALSLIMNSGGDDTKKAVLLFRDLFKQTAYMDGEKRITEARLDSLSHKDLRKMIGKYAANFILS